MPRYRFSCPACGDVFEESFEVGVIEEDLWPACPSCGHENTERQMPRSFSTAYKGGGFTKTPKLSPKKEKEEREE